MDTKTERKFLVGAWVFMIVIGILMVIYLRDLHFKQEQAAQEITYVITDTLVHGKIEHCWLAKVPPEEFDVLDVIFRSGWETYLYYDVEYKAIKSVWEQGNYSVEKLDYGIEICPSNYASGDV